MNKTALLLLDFQQGIGDQPYATSAVPRAAAALEAGRSAGLLVVFSKVLFRPGYADIAPSNPFFLPYKEQDRLPPDASRLVPAFSPRPPEIVVDKNRFSAFSGNDLRLILRAQGVTDLVLGGVITSGVVLTTYCEAADDDFRLTVLADACADPKPSLHQELVTNLFPRSAQVLTADAWASALKRAA